MIHGDRRVLLTDLGALVVVVLLPPLGGGVRPLSALKDRQAASQSTFDSSFLSAFTLTSERRGVAR